MTISSSKVGNDDVDDEVTTVLRHFRPRPEFVSSTAGKDHEWFKSGSSTPRHKQQKKYKKKRYYDRGFTSVQYIAPSTTTKTSNDDINIVGGKIRLAYLHNFLQNNSESDGRGRSISIFLTFEIAVDTKIVTCVCCSAPNDKMSAELKVQIDTMCNALSTTTKGCTTTTTDRSLFLVASQLLQLLNNEFQTTTLSNNTINEGEEEAFDALVSRFTNSNAKSKSINAIYHMLDVQSLLLRCAAAGRNRSKVCAPVPVEFTSSVATCGSSDGDALSHRVFAASNQLYMHGFRDGLPQQQQQQTMLQNDTSDTGTLLSFLLSLPWTGGSRLIQNVSAPSVNNIVNATTGKKQVNGNNNSKAKSKSKVGRICIDIGTALGNPTPSFTDHSSKYGTVQAFHGTKIESAWSIINHGLVNLSHHDSLAANGAMMGEGVYLSSSRQVAEYFAQSAAQQPGPALSSAFQHESILHLLCVANVDISDLEPLECYDIICLPVFEATIIQPSSKSKNDTSGGGISDSINRYTKQEGKYYVCTDGEFIRITKLHLTIELTKKTSMWQLMPRIPISMVVILMAILWMMR